MQSIKEIIKMKTQKYDSLPDELEIDYCSQSCTCILIIFHCNFYHSHKKIYAVTVTTLLILWLVLVRHAVHSQLCLAQNLPTGTMANFNDGLFSNVRILIASVHMWLG